MTALRRLPIRGKLIAIVVIAATAAVVLACAAFVAYEMVTFRGRLAQHLETQAEIMARQSAASLVFKDPESAAATLDALRADPRLVSAAIYGADGALFARYVRDDQPTDSLPRPADHPTRGHRFEKGGLVVFRPIEFDEGVIGTVVIESDLAEMEARLRRYALIALSVLVASIALAYGTASRLQRVITVPVQQLSAAAAIVSARQDYSVRAVAHSDDELGQFVATFNHMLQQIQDRDAALKASEEQYRLLFDGNPHPMWVFDPGTLAFLAVNEAAIRLYGYSREEFLAMTIKDIRPPEDVPRLLERLYVLQGEKNRSAGMWRHRGKDGSLFDVEIDSSSIVLGAKPARLVLVTDVSDKKLLESQLLQSQKMEAVGRLAGGVAHDFSNLLGVISGYSELLGKTMAAGDPGRKRLEQIRQATDAATALTRQLLAFSRKEVIQPKVLDLNQVVWDIENMLERLIGEDVVLVAKTREGLGRVMADRGQIDQVLLNLAVNARDAMPKGGHLIIETANVFLDQAYAQSHADAVPGPYVMLAVSDTGHGMDAATQSHIFEPFFTTKEQGKGTGLGLATVFGIAKQNGGHVNVYSEPGKGASFKLYLPRVDAPAHEAEPTISAAPPRGTETILLVEDAQALRAMIAEILEAAGFRVLESPDPRDAVLRAERHEGLLDLIVTDVVMPGMSGPDLVEVVRGRRPGVKTLFMSGYTNEAIGRQGVLEPGTHFLQKPFTSDALLGAVRRAIDDTGAHSTGAQTGSVVG